MQPSPIIPDASSRSIRNRARSVARDGQPKIVGILNVTPDSFFDGGCHLQLATAVDRAIEMVAEGAAIIDIGGQSTRPGHVEVSVEEEMARVVPVIAALAGRLAVPLSIDSYQPAVVRAALLAGADIVNDVHGFQRNPELADIAAQHGSGAILMHQDAAFPETSGATIERILAFLRRSIDLALAAGVPRAGIVLDPGIGFTKTPAQNLEILARLGELRALGFPILVGASRKSVIGHVLSLPPDQRLEGTLAITALAVRHGVEFIRVHDVRANLRAALMAKAICGSLPPSP